MSASTDLLRMKSVIGAEEGNLLSNMVAALKITLQMYIR